MAHPNDFSLHVASACLRNGGCMWSDVFPPLPAISSPHTRQFSESRRHRTSSNAANVADDFVAAGALPRCIDYSASAAQLVRRITRPVTKHTPIHAHTPSECRPWRCYRRRTTSLGRTNEARPCRTVQCLCQKRLCIVTNSVLNPLTPRIVHPLFCHLLSKTYLRPKRQSTVEKDSCTHCCEDCDPKRRAGTRRCGYFALHELFQLMTFVLTIGQTRTVSTGSLLDYPVTRAAYLLNVWTWPLEIRIEVLWTANR